MAGKGHSSFLPLALKNQNGPFLIRQLPKWWPRIRPWANGSRPRRPSWTTRSTSVRRGTFTPLQGKTDAGAVVPLHERHCSQGRGRESGQAHFENAFVPILVAAHGTASNSDRKQL